MPQPTNDVSKRLEQIRKAKGFATLKAFHQELSQSGEFKVSYEAVRNYHYDRVPPLEYVVAVSKTFDVDLQYLATGTNSPSTNRSVVTTGDDDDEVEWDLWFYLHSSVHFEAQEVLFGTLEEGHVIFDSRVDRLLWRVSSMLANISVAYDLEDDAKRTLRRLESPKGESSAEVLELGEELEQIGLTLGHLLVTPLQDLPLTGVQPNSDQLTQYLAFMLLALEAALLGAHEQAQRHLTPKAMAEFRPSRDVLTDILARHATRFPSKPAHVRSGVRPS